MQQTYAVSYSLDIMNVMSNSNFDANEQRQWQRNSYELHSDEIDSNADKHFCSCLEQLQASIITIALTSGNTPF